MICAAVGAECAEHVSPERAHREDAHPAIPSAINSHAEQPRLGAAAIKISGHQSIFRALDAKR